ncbi:MAG: GAF domain-containing protein [Thermosynechococcaceae cyanobacterium MS004]|nr:GAF domain-containing protein [Thermosynechococcaceae cyanobacterium MS004]
MSQPAVRTEYEKRLVSLQQCLQQVQKQQSTAEIGKVVLPFLKASFPFELVWLAHYDAQSQTLNGIDGSLPKEKDQAALVANQAVLAGDLFDQALMTGRNQDIISLDQESRVGHWQAIAQRQGIQGAAIFPIRYRHQALGILMVGTTLWGGHSRPEELAELKMLTGAIGAALYTLGDRATQAAEALPQRMVETLNAILGAKTFEDRLKRVLASLHKSLQPSRTCLYWFDHEEQSCRLQEVQSGSATRRVSASKPVSLEVPLQQISAFYQATLQQQMIAISDVEGVIQSFNAPTRLMSLTQSRAWLSAPILDRRKLVGVLAVECGQPRLWSEADKQQILMMAQLMGQSFGADPDSAPLWLGGQTHLPSLLNALKEAEEDAAHWEKTLEQCLEQVGLQFTVRWAAIFHHDPEEHVFDCRAQFCQRKKQPLPSQLPDVSTVDAKLLSRLSQPLAVPSLAEDLRFLPWRSLFAAVGMQSYLLVRMGQQTGLGEFLVLGADLPRTWTDYEQEAIPPIAQAIAQAIVRRNQEVYAQQQQQVMTLLTQGLGRLQQTQQVQPLFEIAVDAMTEFLGAECTLILRCSPEDSTATLAGMLNHSTLQIEPTAEIPWQMDSLLQTLLSVTALKGKTSFPGVAQLRGTAADLAANSNWLQGAGFLEVLCVPLQAHPDLPFLGMVLAINTRRKGWSALQREGLQLLTRELAIQVRGQETIRQIAHQCETLECLNWYKQRQLEQLTQLWTSQTSAFQGLLASQETAGAALGSLKGRPQNPIVQLNKAFMALDNMLKTELWELQLEGDVVPIATLLRRSLERIEPIVSSRQLWTQVHNLTPSVSVKMPSQKLESMLTELLLASCYRTKIGDRIDIWCRALPDNLSEVSITDHGRLNPKLVMDLAQYRHTRKTTPTLNSPPGLHFKVCQTLVERLGGRLELAQLEDGRSLSRLILPTAIQGAENASQLRSSSLLS